MIKSFKDRDSQKVFEGKYSKKVPKDLTRTAERKLRILNRAESLDDLRIPPGNRLEALKGNRKDQWSIRVNDQFRICFAWKETDAYDVELIDYHS